MRYQADQHRYVIVYGGLAEVVTDDPTVKVLDRADRVVLAETTHRTAVLMRHRSYLCIHAYERERDARRVFKLFRH